jgi:hypothetical protein
MLDQLVKITGIISNCSIILAMATLVLQLIQNRALNKLTFKQQFIACTERYENIQQILLANDSLNRLNAGFYKDRLPDLPEAQSAIRGKELAMCAMMFQLMEDVWLTHDMGSGKNSDVLSGWYTLFRDWMSNETIAGNWPVFRNYFGKGFVADIERNYLKTNKGDANH